ncbi:unnamed protein product [Arctogadus glacialis]
MPCARKPESASNQSLQLLPPLGYEVLKAPSILASKDEPRTVYVSACIFSMLYALLPNHGGRTVTER